MLYQKILISLEGKEDENSVIHEALRVSSFLKANLEVLHINDPDAGKTHMMMDSLPLVTENDIREQFRKLGYEKESKQITINIVKSPNYHKEIAKACQNVDLLVIGHHHKSGLLASLMDSIDERVSDLISCPMLVVACGN